MPDLQRHWPTFLAGQRRLLLPAAVACRRNTLHPEDEFSVTSVRSRLAPTAYPL